VSTRQGVFAQAHSGTLFISDISELPLDLQAKLLRVIETGEFTMVGGSQPQRANVRIITATNRDLQQAVAKGTFREDLFSRIAVIRIANPPLRERREDSPCSWRTSFARCRRPGLMGGRAIDFGGQPLRG
jgi:two-component system nitrogen regulation response regulator GlnG